MGILSVFELILWSSADSLSPGELSSQAKVLAIFEIVVGLVNWPTLICGIIVLINSGQLTSGHSIARFDDDDFRHPREFDDDDRRHRRG